MPESPEVQALADDLGERLAGRALAEIDVIEFRVVKTRNRPPDGLVGQRVAHVARFGKLLDAEFGSSAHLVVSLGRHGWARYGIDDGRADAPAPAEPVTLLSLAFDDGTVVEFTDAGDWVSLGCWVVDAASEVPAVAKLGPDPADPSFTRAQFDRAFVGRRKQVKAVLQEQESLAGIGNAYSDEILFRARLSPVVPASSLDDDALDRLYTATLDVVRTAVAERRGIPIDRLKQAKVDAMLVHGRTGEPCPGCSGVVRDFSFAGTTAQYCPDCQTDGRILPLKS